MEKLREQLKKQVRELFGVEVEPDLTVAPEGTGADFASNVAMRLAGQLGRPPREVAEEIAANLEGLQMEVAGPGFLNFMLPDEYFLEKVNNFGDFGAEFGKNISQGEYFGKTVICEFSDPNPFKVLHVGHLYTSVVGDAISRLFEFAGAKVVRANFGGDVGLHVAKTLWALEKKSVEDLTIEDIAECYVEGTNAYEESQEAHEEITALNKQIYEIVRDHVDDTRLAKLYWQGRELSYEYFKKFYARIGLKFDVYYPESQTAGRGLDVVREHMDVYEESDGAVVFKGEPYGLHTRVFINKEGLPTYEAKDVGLLFTKWDDYHFDKSVVITGNDIIDYMKVVLKSVSMYAPELTERTVHLTHGNVRLPGNEKMSSRKGNFIRAVDILDRVAEVLRESYDSEDEKVALGAIKYAFLKYKVGGNIEFSVDESVSMTGNSGPYLQYSAVRAKKVVSAVFGSDRSSSGRVGSAHRHGRAALNLALPRSGCPAEEGPSQKSPYELSSHERKLVKKMAGYTEVLVEALNEMAPHKICAYLYELAQEFSRFYENVKVVGSEYEAERGEMVQNYLKILTHGLGLLGIEVPEKM